MHLAKLELVGFKSFADKTEFAFEPGITALLGPNGCGKSNVVDAVRWILGEQRARVVRGSEMADVIFNGTEKRRSMGYAEASLTVLNNDRKLPIDYQEVSITRRIYRTAECEYFINGQPCRLRDIRALFTDTGVGMDSYSIIEQGKVDQILQANAQERRAIFEEAAGISGYKEQRRQAQAKLERCKQNLLRVNDLMLEKEKRLRSVKHQAAKARRHTEYTDRLKALAVALAQRNYSELEQQVKRAQEELVGLDAQRTSLSTHLENVEKQITQLRELARQQQESHNAKEQEIHLLDSRVSTQEERVRSGKLRGQEFEEAADNASRNVGAISEKISRAQSDLHSADEELTLTDEAIRLQTAEVEKRAAAAHEAAGQADELEQAIEERKGKVWDYLQKSTGLRNQLAQLGSRSQQDEAQRARLTSRYAAVQKELGNLEEQQRRLAEDRADLNRRIAEREKSIASCLDEARGLGEELAKLSAEATQLQSTCMELRSRRNVLEEMDAKAAGIQQGVQRLLGRQAPDAPEQGPAPVGRPMPGVIGMVADLLEVELPHATAIEAALGGRAQDVVCRDTQAALTALKTLREERAGRAALLPLDRVRSPRFRAKDLPAEAGVVAPAEDLIRYAAEMEPVVASLLGDVLIVQGISDALRLSRNGGRDLRLVTLEGDLFEPWGAVAGGDRTAVGGVLSRRSERRAVERRLGELTADMERLDRHREELVQRSRSLEERRRSLERDLTADRDCGRDIQSRQEIVASQRKRLEDEVAVIKSETHEIEDNLRSCTDQEARLKEDLLRLTKLQAQLEAEIEGGKSDLRSRRERAAMLTQEVTALQVALAHKTEKRDSLKQRIGLLKRELEEASSEFESARRLIEVYRKKRAEAQEQVAESQQKVLELRSARQQLERELAEWKARGQDTQRQLAQVEGQMHELRRQLAELQPQHENLRLREHEARVRMADLADRVRDEYEVSVAEMPAPTEDRNWEEAQREVSELQQKLRMMGPVNLEAIGEQDELEASIRFHTEQRDDLTEAEKTLNELIARLNKICRERFQRTFEEIRQNFRELFRKVFGGGRADIYLVSGEPYDPASAGRGPGSAAEEAAPQPAGGGQAGEAAAQTPPKAEEPDILEAGIEIVASPPGKELKSIRQLSGGEKSMTTIALLFAIFKTKPSPFCILDEVDAALDESNIDRFIGIVREFMSNSQFIIITHSKRTLGVADVLYGITMEEQGVSKKVAVKLNQALRMAA